MNTNFSEKIDSKIETYEEKIKTLRAVNNVVNDLTTTLLDWYTTTDEETTERKPLDWRTKEYEITLDLIDYIQKVYLK